jgi:hypothetical protein
VLLVTIGGNIYAVILAGATLSAVVPVPAAAIAGGSCSAVDALESDCASAIGTCVSKHRGNQQQKCTFSMLLPSTLMSSRGKVSSAQCLTQVLDASIAFRLSYLLYARRAILLCPPSASINAAFYEPVTLTQELKSRTYERSLRRVIPKTHGKQRPLGVPAIKDHGISAAVLLEPIEADLRRNSTPIGQSAVR